MAFYYFQRINLASNHPSQHLPRVFSASSWSQIWSVSAISRKYFKALDALVPIGLGDHWWPLESGRTDALHPKDKNTQTSRVQVTILGFGISSRNSLRKSWQVLSSNLPTSILCTGAFRKKFQEIVVSHDYLNSKTWSGIVIITILMVFCFLAKYLFALERNLKCFQGHLGTFFASWTNPPKKRSLWQWIKGQNRTFMSQELFQ